MGLKGAAYGWAAGAALDFYFKQKKSEKRKLFRAKNHLTKDTTDDVVDQMIEDAELKKSQEALRLDYNEGIIWGRDNPIKAFFYWLLVPIISSIILNAIVTFIIINAQNGYAVQHTTKEFSYGLQYAPNLPYAYWLVLSSLMTVGFWFAIEYTWPWLDNWLRRNLRFFYSLFNVISIVILFVWMVCVIGFYIHW